MTPQEKDIIKAMFNKINHCLTLAGPGLTGAKRAIEDALYKIDKMKEDDISNREK